MPSARAVQDSRASADDIGETPAGAAPEIRAVIDPALLSAGIAPDQIARAIIALLGDRPRLERLASASRARVDPAMGWPAVAARYLELYRESHRASKRRPEPRGDAARRTLL